MWIKQHCQLLVLLVLIFHPAYMQTGSPSEQCGSVCIYTEWALDADCKNQGLSAVPAACSGVELLDLRHNQIKVLPDEAFDGFGKLRFLDLEMMELEAIEPGAFAGSDHLLNIYLQLNSLQAVRRNTFDGATNLKQLFLNGNDILTVDSGAFDGIQELETLFLSDNNITDIAYDLFHNLTQLRYLYLDNNRLTALPVDAFLGLANLRHLSLAGNSLIHLLPGLFDGLHNLRALKLAFNNIASIGSFPRLPRLYHLDLYNNNLTSVQALQNVFDPPQKNTKRSINTTKKDKLVFLGENPLTCDCEIEPLRVWVRAHYDTIQGHRRGNATCTLPNSQVKVSLYNQQTPFCPTTVITEAPTSAVVPSSAHTGQDSSGLIMPITIGIVVLSCIVLVCLVIWAISLRLTNSGKHNPYKRQTSVGSVVLK